MTVMDEQPETQVPASDSRAPALAQADRFGPGFFVKLVLMAIVNALGVYLSLIHISEPTRLL